MHVKQEPLTIRERAYRGCVQRGGGGAQQGLADEGLPHEGLPDEGPFGRRAEVLCIVAEGVCWGGGRVHMGSAANNGATFTESMSDKEKLQDDGDGGCAPDTANGC